MLPSAPFTLQEGALHIVPVLHDRLEFAHEVRRAILAVRPTAVAIELHEEIREPYTEAVNNLPYLSAIEQKQQGVDNPLFFSVAPTDPFSEAVRTAAESGIPVHFVDLNVREYPAVYEPYADSYAVHHIGLGAYYESHRLKTAETQRVAATTNQDEARERHMAALLSDLLMRLEGRSVLFVCGMTHAERIARHVREKTGQRGVPHPIEEMKLVSPDLDFVRATAEEIPFLMVAYEFDRKGPGSDETWEAPKSDEPPPESESPLEALTKKDVLGSLETLLGMALKPKPQDPILTPAQQRRLAQRLNQLMEQRTLESIFGGNAGAIPRIRRPIPEGPGGHRIFKFRAVEDRRPELRDIYAEASRLRHASTRMLDRQRVSLRFVKTAARFYEQNTGETFKGWQLRTMLQFLRSWTRLRGLLLPRIWWDWTVAARGVSDDNYAYEVWDLASFYPWTDEKYPSLTIEGLNLRKIVFRRRWPRFRERFMKAPVRPRQQEAHAGDWAKEFDSGTICSYPPEDLLIEDYGRYLKKKAVLMLSEERTRTEPFTTSLLDGIDVRETIRNWPRTSRENGGGRIYVREIQKIKGGAGSVVVIFDDDPDDTRYPWKMTWHGEHEQESDMAFYSTDVYAKIVGPGIARCEYGGLMLTYPPRRVLDVWGDPFYGEAQTKAEVLLLAAIEYSVEKHVVYVAAKPPRSLFRSRADRVGRKIVYLPIAQLSPVTIKKLRVFHVLSGHHVRDFARDYVW